MENLKNSPLAWGAETGQEMVLRESKATYLEAESLQSGSGT